ncbi:hypothetical protein [Micromonospora sp. NPDC005324]|uniref:hypothetical protein n=1 Tax=Micromonospora sp. NPDC005324 TaxID=3157033 RepID=UPI00339FA823
MRRDARRRASGLVPRLRGNRREGVSVGELGRLRDLARLSDTLMVGTDGVHTLPERPDQPEEANRSDREAASNDHQPPRPPRLGSELSWALIG